MLTKTETRALANNQAPLDFNSYNQYLAVDQEEEEEEDEEEEEIEEDDMIDLWVVRNSLEEGTSQLEVLTYQNKLNCVNRKMINVCNEKIESICVYNGNQIWLVDSLKFIYIYW